MNKFKKALVSTGIAAALVLGGGVAQVATAAPAQAVTYTHWKFVANCMPYPSAWLKWADYNWWEETFLGKRDGYVFHSYVYRYC